MLNAKKPFFSAILAILVLLIIVSWTHGVKSDDIYSSISKNLPVLGLIYKEVSSNYVDEIDPERFLRAGIDGMLNTLDPYTTYIEREDRHQLQILTQGKYGGVGMPLNMRNNAVTVVEPPFLGTPAARVGIREGDAIIEVDGTPTQDLTLDEAARRIRGPVGTEVTLKIHREGVSKLLEFTLIREQIKVDDVRYAGFIDDGIGYILLTRFSKNAGPEVADAIQEMKQQGLKSLILDLRSNPGGILEAAVEVADLFLPKGTLIVSTKGRTKSSVREEVSRNIPILGNRPLAILVNRFSASASEIVAGAIQDHDRGVVIGDTTFGKGLVQTVLPLTPKAALKITTAKYFTPSGRSIQRANYSMWEDSTNSDVLAFETDAGRKVTGGGGIIPDITVQLPTVDDIVWDMRRKSLFFNFAVHYTSIHEKIDTDVKISDEMFSDFKTYLKTKNFNYRHPIETRLSNFRDASKEAGYDAHLLASIDNLQNAIDGIKDDMLTGSRKDIERLLKRELTSKYFGVHRGVEVGIETDLVVQQTLDILKSPKEYSRTLEN